VSVEDNMALAHSPSIVMNGLVLCLDAGNTKSYPGSGTTWNDISGNGNHGSLINGVSYSSSNGGVLVTNGTNQYIDVIGLNLSTSNNTVMCATRYVDLTTPGRIVSARSNNWLLGHHSGNNSSYYAEGWVYNPSNSGSGNIWRIYTATGDYSNDSWGIYVNGQFITSNANGINGPNGFSLGRYGPGNTQYSKAEISVLYCYNRVLSNTEIQQNFNALRGRYGI
jgi:hypothetical protein